MSNEKKNDGGPAFPYQFKYGYRNSPSGEVTEMGLGMSLRDYFAAKAMACIFSGGVKVEDPVEKNAADAAYRMADAMLKAREL